MSKGKVPSLTLGDRLMLAREKRHIGSQEIADHFKVSRHTITNWEKGRSNPSHTEIVEWARVTDYDVEWLLDGQLDTTSNAAAMREELARRLVELLRGGDSDSQPTGLQPRWGYTMAELDLAPIIDLRTEPARVLQGVA